MKGGPQQPHLNLSTDNLPLVSQFTVNMWLPTEMIIRKTWNNGSGEFLSSDLDNQIGDSLSLQLNHSRSTTAALEKNLHDLFPSQEDKAYNFGEVAPDNIGLEVLVLPPDPLIDIIFVHGFWGGARKSWSKSANPANFWPKEWLRKDPEFKHARISSYGYAGDFNHQDGPHDLSKVGTSLFHELESSSYINDNRMVCQRDPSYGTHLK